MKFSIFNFQFSILILVFFFLFSASIYADSVVVEIDTKGERVNAIEGTLVLPKGFDLKSVHTGQSSILIWITQPKLDASTRIIVFAGLTPGGFSGSHSLFSLVGNFEEADLDEVVFRNVKALRDDGEGSEVEVAIGVVGSRDIIDITSPEPFVVTISRDEEIFSNNFFASFQTSDKGTGVLKYEISEKFLLPPSQEDWQEVTSPQEIKDKRNLKKVYVRALDHEGNSRISSTSLPNRKYAIMFFVIIILVPCMLFIRRLQKRFLSSY